MLSRPRALPFGVGSELTSAEANALNVMIESALDKRPGQSDTLASIVTLASAARINVPAGAILNVQTGGSCSVDSGATCSVGGILYITSGATLNVQVGGFCTMQGHFGVTSGATLECFVGSFAKFRGECQIASGGVLRIQNGGSLLVEAGATFSLTGANLIATTLSGANTLPSGSSLSYSPARVVSRVLSIYGVTYSVGWSTSLIVGYQSTGAPSSVNFLMMPLNDLPHGSTLNSVDFVFYATVHTPTLRMRLDICRVLRTTPSMIPEFLQSVVTNYLIPGAEVPVYVNGYQSANMVMDQNNVIDTVNYVYLCRIYEESGGVTGNVASNIRTNCTVTNVLSAAI